MLVHAGGEVGGMHLSLRSYYTSSSPLWGADCSPLSGVETASPLGSQNGRKSLMADFSDHNATSALGVKTPLMCTPPTTWGLYKDGFTFSSEQRKDS